MTKQQRIEDVLLTISGGKAVLSSLWTELSKAEIETSDRYVRWCMHRALKRLNRAFEALDALEIELEAESGTDTDDLREEN